jgi:hypothetical protein
MDMDAFCIVGVLLPICQLSPAIWANDWQRSWEVGAIMTFFVSVHSKKGPTAWMRGSNSSRADWHDPITSA